MARSNSTISFKLEGLTKKVLTANYGTVFRMTTNGWLTTLVVFNRTNGGNPLTKLLSCEDGSLIGTTVTAATNPGTLFQIWPDGRFRTIYSFTGNLDGGQPRAALIRGNDGALYGMTSSGGAQRYGTIYRLSLPMCPVFESVIRNGGALELKWSAVAGQSYQLQYKTDLDAAGWTNLGKVRIATNATLTASDTVDPEGQRFYRMMVLP